MENNLWRFLWQVIKENSWFLAMYLLIVGLLGSTLYFHEIPLSIYLDTLLFTGPVVLLILLWRGLRLWRKHQHLQSAIQQKQLYELSILQKATLLEQDYHQLLAKIQEQLKQTEENYEQKEKDLLDYSVLWSHQIKTPLASIDLLIQMMESKEKQALKEEAFKIQQYLDMMLQYLRLQSIQQDFRFETVEYQPIVKNLIKKYARFFIYKDLEIELVNLEQTVTTDKKWFSFLLEQIVFNAIKYTHTGSICIYSPEDDPQQIRVKDTGQGILPEDLPRVFERGYTGFNGHNHEGSSGLGLYMCREIADQLGITLDITSTINQGTEVCLTLPASLQVE